MPKSWRNSGARRRIADQHLVAGPQVRQQGLGNRSQPGAEQPGAITTFQFRHQVFQGERRRMAIIQELSESGPQEVSNAS